jgi:trehalose 6-phosphate phosphatase
LIALDYDGTLAPIVSDPGRATMRPMTRRLLEAVSKLYPCIVISGRAQRDALMRLRGVRLHQVVGNHGMEPWHGTSSLIKEVQHWRAILEHHLALYKGVHVEDKVFSLAIHYRQSREKKKARAAILRAVALLGQARIIGGKQVVNVLPLGAPHKGVALERERERLGCDTAIYIGDDETDEDVFTLDQPGRLLTIRVGAKSTSAASFYISGQSAIDTVLRVLIDLRQECDQRREAAR